MVFQQSLIHEHISDRFLVQIFDIIHKLVFLISSMAHLCKHSETPLLLLLLLSNNLLIEAL